MTPPSGSRADTRVEDPTDDDQLDDWADDDSADDGDPDAWIDDDTDDDQLDDGTIDDWANDGTIDGGWADDDTVDGAVTDGDTHDDLPDTADGVGAGDDGTEPRVMSGRRFAVSAAVACVVMLLAFTGVQAADVVTGDDPLAIDSGDLQDPVAASAEMALTFAVAAQPAADPAAGVPTAPAQRPATTPAPVLAALYLDRGRAQNAVDRGSDNPNCTLIVPADPLSAKGLATPYQLVATNPGAGACREANANQSAFVQAAIIAPDGSITLYNPLVVTSGQAPAAPTVPATIPAGSTVGIWFGFNGDVLTLRSANGTNALTQGACVNGRGRSLFGQFAHCNAPAFFAAANAAIAAGTLDVPAVGTARDGLPCPTVRDFSVVDQDQSDNVNTHYVAGRNGATAQPGALNRRFRGGTDLANGSDNRLLVEFMLPTLGCQSFTRPDQSNHGKLTASLPLQELQAAAGQAAPVALIPLNDPMTLENGNQSRRKTNLFRAGVDQPQLGQAANGDPVAYCDGIYNDPAGMRRVFAARDLFSQGASPAPDDASNLFTFLAGRANAAFDELDCGRWLNQTNPITLQMDGDRVVDATFGANNNGNGNGNGQATTTTVQGASTTAAGGASTTVAPSSTSTTRWRNQTPTTAPPSTTAPSTTARTGSTMPSSTLPSTTVTTTTGSQPSTTATTQGAIGPPTTAPTAP